MAKKVFKTVGKVAGLAAGIPGAIIGNAVGGVLGSALGKKKKAAAPANGPVVMPLPDDDAVMRARRASIAKQMSRGGRSSTILSESGDTLGGY